MIINREIYDIETLASCFTYTGLNIETEKVVQFVLHRDCFELEELIKHLNTLHLQVGFNNVNFDYPVLHYIYSNYGRWIKDLERRLISRDDVIVFIHQEAERIIAEQNKKEFTATVAIKQRDWIIYQHDLFKMWHYNNKARATSLKSLQVSMNLDTVMEMPISHTRTDIALSEVPSILEYNLNDVLATYEFWKRSKDKIALRKQLSELYEIQCYNFSDTKIGEQLILELYCKYTGENKWRVKELRTNRLEIKIKDCILPYISFKTDKFKQLLEKFNETVISGTKGSFKYKVVHKGFKYDYGTGGIHGCVRAGVYSKSDIYEIIDCDVASLYPSIAIVNEFYPEHLGKAFVQVYKDMVAKRKEAKAAGNMVLSDAFKLAANSVYGKSNDEHSFLKDPMYTMKTTINGQLVLTMLVEMLLLEIPLLQVLQINTDGITVKINKDFIGKYYEICKKWEELTKLTLEYVNYSKMIIADVNNYIAVKEDGKCKYKGRFEIEKVVGSEVAYHKDNSFKIVPIAISDYFVKGIPIAQTIRNHNNILDFCGRQKFNIDSYGQTVEIAYDDTNNPISIIKKQQKVTRYYITKRGATFVKRYTKGTSAFIHKGFQVRIFNKLEVKDNYEIDYDFYELECLKEIRNIEPAQLSLF